MFDSTTRTGRLRTLAGFVLLLVFVVVVASAYMRLTKAGLGCSDWPACYGLALGADPAQTGSTVWVVVARMLHRFSALAVLILSLTIGVVAFRSRPILAREGGLAIALVLIAGLLAVLGRYSAGNPLPIVAIGNVLGGFSMLAIAERAWRGPRRGAGVSVLSLGLLLALFIQIAIGVFVSAGYAGLSCTTLSPCSLGDWTWATFDPMRAPELGAQWPPNPQGIPIHMLHRAMAILVSILTLAVAVRIWRRGDRRHALLLVALLATQAVIGFILISASLPLLAALLHNLVAALFLLATIAALRR